MKVAREGASYAGDMRKRLEKRTGKSALSGRNAKELKAITVKK